MFPLKEIFPLVSNTPSFSTLPASTFSMLTISFLFTISLAFNDESVKIFPSFSISSCTCISLLAETIPVFFKFPPILSVLNVTIVPLFSVFKILIFSFIIMSFVFLVFLLLK